MEIIDEPVDKLFLWGHSACTVDTTNHKKVIVFGGFGGMGRHARRNNTLLLDPLHGTLKVVNAEGTPSPRLGHTSSMVGDLMFVLGGRADPEKILNDVWVLNTTKNEWRLLECTGCVFPPRCVFSAFFLLLFQLFWSFVHLICVGSQFSLSMFLVSIDILEYLFVICQLAGII